MKKKDIFLILIVLIIAGAFLLFNYMRPNLREGVVVVKIHGKVVKTYDLAKDGTYKIKDGENVIQIKDKKVKMIEATCPDKICVHHKAISKDGESIICLPHKLVVEIDSKKKSEFDFVV
ncbi:MAG: NusG domain II-containing protein [Lachnospiraceae bacterium]|jgi:hypothetical protein|nr:NusG domain II-containing protein [Lachnospiraceae bacterium]